jgi:DNA-binding transcriptional LysR family regulator
MFGRLHLLPIAQDFMRAHPQLKVSLLLLNRMVSFIDEGIDLGLRIAHLQDSSLQAIQIGSVRRVVCASPGYLAHRGLPETPEALAHHDCIAVAGVRSAQERWSFGAGPSEITVQLDPRLVVNTVQAAIDAALSGFGVVRPLSYQSAPLEPEGRLRRILTAYEPPPIPIHLVHPAGRYLAPKVRLFIDFAVAILRGKFSH